MLINDYLKISVWPWHKDGMLSFDIKKLKSIMLQKLCCVLGSGSHDYHNVYFQEQSYMFWIAVEIEILAPQTFPSWLICLKVIFHEYRNNFIFIL